ncbi:MAG TPA: SRPBCC family protein [Bryobacteraceae bacterium]|nr:SRPBCC family protein [Bryobacteraceae bacterium]
MDINRKAPVVASAEGPIRAPLDLVWAVHTDIAAWAAWNPDVQSVAIDGPVRPGTQFRWKSGGATIISKIEEVEPRRRIVWTGRAVGLRAVHVWTFAGQDGGVWVRSEESFQGLIAVLFGGAMRRRLGSALQRGVVALKKECERRVQ